MTVSCLVYVQDLKGAFELVIASYQSPFSHLLEAFQRGGDGTTCY